MSQAGYHLIIFKLFFSIEDVFDFGNIHRRIKNIPFMYSINLKTILWFNNLLPYRKQSILDFAK